MDTVIFSNVITAHMTKFFGLNVVNFLKSKTIFLLILVLTGLAGCSKNSDIPVREKYWTKEMKSGLPIGSEQAVIEAFFTSRGQKLECFTQEGNMRISNDRKTPNACSIADSQSAGGFANHPVKLAIDFEMQDGKMVSSKFGTTAVSSGS